MTMRLSVVCGALIGCCIAAQAAGLSASEEAAKLNTEAMEIAMSGGSLTDALERFQRAVSTRYHNNEGVTLLRLGRLDDAEVSFERALELSPSSQDAMDNLDEVYKLQGKSKPKASDRRSRLKKHFGSPDEGDDAPPRRAAKQPGMIEHTVRRLPRIHVSDLFKYENAEYAGGRQPFMLTGVVDPARGWPADAVGNSSWGYQYFHRTFPSAIVDFYPHNMGDRDVKPYLVNMKQAMDDLVRPQPGFPRSTIHPGAYAQWNMDVASWREMFSHFGAMPDIFVSDDAWLDGCLSSDSRIDNYLKATHWRMALIGSRGAGMFNHVDTLRTASWQLQLVGSKHWHLCSPDNDQYMHGPGGFDVFNPDYSQAPEFRHADCYLDELTEGNMLFYPKDYWHQTLVKNESSVSITGTLIDRNNWEDVAEQLHSDCYIQKRVHRPSDTVCKLLDTTCRDWWKQAFVGSMTAGASDPVTAA